MIQRHDVWSDVGRPEDAPLYAVARGLATTTAFALARGLREGGWKVEVRPADPENTRTPGHLDRGRFKLQNR